MLIFLVTACANPTPAGPCSKGDLDQCVLDAIAIREKEGFTTEAVRLLRKACDGGSPTGCDLLGAAQAAGGIDGQDPPLDLYRRGCEGGDPHACANAGAALVAADDPAGVKLLEQACTRDVAIACQNLGTLSAKGRHVPQNDERAVQLYRRACELPAPECTQIADRLLHGRGVEQDADKAIELLRRGCSHSSKACDWLGEIYTEGAQVPADPSKAAEAFRAACDLGSGFGCRGLGTALYGGSGVAKDIDAAIPLLDKGCRLDDSVACGMLGAHHANAGARDLALDAWNRSCRLGLQQACDDARKLGE